MTTTTETAVRELLKEILERDHCRCDTSVCYWCRTDGWIQVHPQTVVKLRHIYGELKRSADAALSRFAGEEK